MKRAQSPPPPSQAGPQARGYEHRQDGARVSPAAFLRSELHGVAGMGYLEMLRR